MKTTTLLTLLIMTGLLLTGCQPLKPASLSNDQVVQAVDHVLRSVNSSDYQGFIMDFSDAMKTAFPQAQFTSLHDTLQNTSGNYVSCEQPALTNSQGYAVYRLNCKFDRENVLVTVTYQTAGDKIEGLFFDSTNLRKTGK
jgi:hypothetical protein